MQMHVIVLARWGFVEGGLSEGCYPHAPLHSSAVGSKWQRGFGGVVRANIPSTKHTTTR